MICKMSNTKYTDNELNLMSYQDLRRLSILLRLPANIKKTYMISMIQAHQKGDGFTKTAIANKVMEERKVKRMSSKGRQTKPFIMVSTTTTQQIPTDLSMATKHEFETRFSYVAHYTSKDNTTSGISRIIKEEAEVSRRNRNIVQTRKPSRKLATMGRTEIMLPRNHSLTTPVRLMPQYERSYAPLTQYETVSGMTNTKAQFQDGGSYNYHFHGEYSNTMMTASTTQEMYSRSEAYWHPREMYNNSLMPILSSLLTPNSVSMNPPGFAGQYASQNAAKAQTSFQGIYEKYVKSGALMEDQSYQSNGANSTVIVNTNHYPKDADGGYNEDEGGFVVSKNDMDFEVNSPAEVTNYLEYNRRDDTVIRHSNNSQPFVIENYSPVTVEQQMSPVNGRDYVNCMREFFEEKDSDVGSNAEQTLEKSTMPFQSKAGNLEMKHCHVNTPPALEECNHQFGKNFESDDKIWNETENDQNKEQSWRKNWGKNNFMAVSMHDASGVLLSDISESSNECVDERAQNNEECINGLSEKYAVPRPSQQRCRYILGHNKCPEMLIKEKKDTQTSILPSFWSTFCTYGARNKAYSLCRSSFTGTTETHVNPIMTSTYATQYSHHGNPQLTSNNPEESPQVSRPWIYSYPETQSSFPVENDSAVTYSTWNEYSSHEMFSATSGSVRIGLNTVPFFQGNKFVSHENGHEVQVVKCRKHGCHYLYSVSNTCN